MTERRRHSPGRIEDRESSNKQFQGDQSMLACLLRLLQRHASILWHLNMGVMCAEIEHR